MVCRPPRGVVVGQGLVHQVRCARAAAQLVDCGHTRRVNESTLMVSQRLARAPNLFAVRARFFRFGLAGSFRRAHATARFRSAGFGALSSPRLNLGVVPVFPLAILAGELEGKCTEKNIKMTSIMHIGF